MWGVVRLVESCEYPLDILEQLRGESCFSAGQPQLLVARIPGSTVAGPIVDSHFSAFPKWRRVRHPPSLGAVRINRGKSTLDAALVNDLDGAEKSSCLPTPILALHSLRVAAYVGLVRFDRSVNRSTYLARECVLVLRESLHVVAKPKSALDVTVAYPMPANEFPQRSKQHVAGLQRAMKSTIGDRESVIPTLDLFLMLTVYSVLSRGALPCGMNASAGPLLVEGRISTGTFVGEQCSEVEEVQAATPFTTSSATGTERLRAEPSVFQRDKECNSNVSQ